MTKFDVTIIGAGHNGLVLAAYLAKAGAKVLVLERRHEIGGGLCTEEVTLPGFRHNLHSIFHMMTDAMPVLNDLQLQDYGVSYLCPEATVSMPLKDGKSITMYRDPAKTCASIAKVSPKDADAYRQMYAEFKAYMDEIIIPATYVPPKSPLELAVSLESSDFGHAFLSVAEKSAKEIVDERFEDERIKMLLLYLATCWGVRYDETGLGFVAILYIDRATRYTLCYGGSHRLSSALAKVVVKNGGQILESEEVTRIIVKNDTAVGVETASGLIVESRAVASNVDPPQTFLKLVGRDRLSEDLTMPAGNWQWEESSLFAVHSALNNPPNYAASKFDPAVNESLMVVMGYESVDDLLKHLDAVYARRLPERPAGNAICPTVFDPSQAPAGKHASMFETHAPYALAEGGAERWDHIRSEYAERCLALWKEYAPNITAHNVIANYPYTPLDIERKLSNMVEGSIKHGRYTPLQMGYFRPNNLCSQYRTPVKGLYLCGSSCYPGGMITSGPGYNAASVMAEDLGLNKWWTPPPFVTKALEKGYI